MEATLDDEKPETSSSSIGYQRLADYMAWNPSAAIFERFRSANILNLLGLQAEIENLQDQLIRVPEADKAQHESSGENYETNWAFLQEGEDGKSRKKELILRLRATLEQYNTALIQQITLSNQPNPRSRDLRQLCEWIEDLYGLSSDLRGSGSRLWFSRRNGELRVEDKFAVSQRPTDSFTQLLVKGLSKISPILPDFTIQRRTFPAYKKSNLNPLVKRDFEMLSSTGAIIATGDKLATVISCVLITVPVVILNYIKNTSIRLGLIVLFTLAFSLTLSFVSDAKRKEIFAAAAVFVAVQVVFVGTSGNL